MAYIIIHLLRNSASFSGSLLYCCRFIVNWARGIFCNSSLTKWPRSEKIVKQVSMTSCSLSPMSGTFSIIPFLTEHSMLTENIELIKRIEYKETYRLLAKLLQFERWPILELELCRVQSWLRWTDWRCFYICVHPNDGEINSLYFYASCCCKSFSCTKDCACLQDHAKATEHFCANECSRSHLRSPRDGCWMDGALECRATS